MRRLLLGSAWVLILLFRLECADLKLIKEIGSDEDNYMFIRISGAVLSQKKDIYVLDFKGNFLARYDWNGRFIKKIGRRGQGPRDFNGPGYLNEFQGKLYFFDGRNLRIAVVDLELKNVGFYKIYDGRFFHTNFFAVGKNKFVGNAFQYDTTGGYKAIRILDVASQSSEMFFHHIPVRDPNIKKKLSNIDTISGTLRFYFSPCFGIDRKGEKMLISFIYPDNPIDFYLYSFEGQCLETFSYDFAKGYQYPDYMKKGKSPPPEHTKIMVGAIFFHKKHHIVFVSKSKMKDRLVIEKKKYCLVFDEQNKELKHKIPVPEVIEAFSLSEDGYLLCTRHREEIPKLCIYKLEL